LIDTVNCFHLTIYWELGVEKEYTSLGQFEKSELAPIEHLFENHEYCREYYTD
jgi:hypothetical protein